MGDLCPFGSSSRIPPTVETSDGSLTLGHSPSPFPEFAAVLGVNRPDVDWSEFEVSVDFTGWTAGEATSSGLWLHSRLHLGAAGLANDYFLGIVTNGPGEAANADSQYDWTTASMAFNFAQNGLSVGNALATMAIPELDPST